MNCVMHMDGKAYLERELIEVTIDGRQHTVMVLTEQEAKALISKEYGFEFNRIKIEGTCWYEATDMNHFRFSVNDMHYAADNFEHLEIIHL